MTTPKDAQFARGLSALEAGRYSETYEFLRPLADTGNAEAQAYLGSIVASGLHRFLDWAAYSAWSDTASPDQIAAFYAEHAERDRKLAEVWLEAASDAGYGGASFNLAMMYVTGIGEDGWDQKRSKILALLARARVQGFDCIDYGEPPGEDYLQSLERCAALHERHASRHHEGPIEGSSPDANCDP